MLLRKDDNNGVSYEEDWPLHYYDIKDISEREKILRSVIERTELKISSMDASLGSAGYVSAGNEASSPDSLKQALSDNERRLEILLKRYPSKSEGTIRHDAFLAAWMNILITGRMGINFLNKGRVKKEVTGYLRDLCVMDFPLDSILISEWEDFSKLWITSCLKDKTYDSTIFGLIRLSDRNLASKIASDIIEVTCRIPQKFGYENLCESFRDVLKNTYISMILDGEKYWNEIM